MTAQFHGTRPPQAPLARHSQTASTDRHGQTEASSSSLGPVTPSADLPRHSSDVLGAVPRLPRDTVPSTSQHPILVSVLDSRTLLCWNLAVVLLDQAPFSPVTGQDVAEQHSPICPSRQMDCMAHCGHCDHAITPRPDACSHPCRLEPGRTPDEIANLTSRSDSFSFITPEAAGLSYPFPSASIAEHRSHTRPPLRVAWLPAHPLRPSPHPPHTPTLSSLPSSSSLLYWPLASLLLHRYIHFLLLGALSWPWSWP